MGAIAVLVHREKQTTANAVVSMLKVLSHRGKDAFAIATANTQTLTDSIEKINVENMQSNIVLGYAFSKILPKDTPQLVTKDNISIAFDGRIYPPSKILNMATIVKKLKSNPAKNAAAIIKNCNGAYVFAIATPNYLVVGRDTMGLTPFYFAKNKTQIAFASERKALWRLGLRNLKSFPSGNIAVIKKDLSFSQRPVEIIKQPPLKQLEINLAAKSLQKLLLQSVRDRVSDLREVAVAFSGGLDSSIIAFLAQKCNVKVHLITVGLENMPEIKYAINTAKVLDMPIYVKTYTTEDVKKTLSKVLWLIEEPNAISVSIAIPFYWATELAAAHGLNVLLAGQGADELFGGYHRYLNIYAQKGANELQKTLLHDVAMCYEKNFQRDNKICVFHNVELRLPFADLRVINYALSLPLSYKIESLTDRLRKRILRKVAEKLNMPKFIANKTKKAVQYATGVDKVLRKIAKRENLNASEYVSKVFKEIFPDVKLND